MKAKFPINYGLRFFAACVLLVPTFFTANILLLTPKFQIIYAEMLNGAQLPGITRLVFKSYLFATAIPLVLFIGTCIILATSKRPQFPYYVTGCAFIAAVILSSFAAMALYSPIVSIIGQMNQ